MFVPVIAYDPDLFADFLLVFSQIEIANSVPYVPATETATALARTQPTAADTLALRLFAVSTLMRQTIKTDDSVVLKAPASTQIQSKFTSRTFASNLPAPSSVTTLVTGEFQTTASIDPLFDNLVFQVSVGNLNLSDTRANNKPVAPMVG